MSGGLFEEGYKVTKDNAAAADLWAQIFQRSAADPWAALVDPDHDAKADGEQFRAAMVTAGWSVDEIDEMEQAEREQVASAPFTSPGVNPRVEAHMAQLADDVEAAMDELGITSHAKVARGIEPRVGPIATKTGVIMTDQSIVTVGAFLFRFCGLVARAFTRTLQINPWVWEDKKYTQEDGLSLLRSRPDLVAYWLRIYLAFATTGTHLGVPFRPSAKHEVLLMEEIARAMEIFAIAHEYGHHHFAHGRDIEADPYAQEFEADQFALRISSQTDRRRFSGMENPYLVSGAGGAVLLMATTTLREIDELLGAQAASGDTHPAAADRIARFNSVRVLQPAEFHRL